MPEDVPHEPQHASKISPRRPQMLPRPPQDAQDGPKSRQDASLGFKIASPPPGPLQKVL